MTSTTSIATPASTLVEQSITASLTAETMQDADDGHLALVAYTEGNAGDLREVAPARLRHMVAETRKRLDEIERLANEYEASDTLAAILAENHARLEEWDASIADPKLREVFAAAAYVENGQMVVAVPLGQDPIERTHFVAIAVNRFAEQEAQA